MRKALIFGLMAALTASSALASKFDASFAESTVVETTLMAASPSPFAGLDLIPDATPLPTTMARNLDPEQVSLNPGHRYLVAGLNGARFGDTLYDASLLVMVGLNVADYLSTSQAMKYPGLAEGNPIMKPFVKNPYLFAAAKIGMTTLTYFGFKGVYKRNKPLGWILATATNFALSYVVSNNYRLIAAARAH